MGQSSRDDMEVQPLCDHTERHAKIAGYCLLIDIARKEQGLWPGKSMDKCLQSHRRKNVALLDGDGKGNEPFWPCRLLF